MRASYDTRSSELLETLQWDILSIRRKKQKVIAMFKPSKYLAPDCMQNIFVPRSSNYTLRNSVGLVHLPIPHTDYLKRSFS